MRKLAMSLKATMLLVYHFKERALDNRNLVYNWFEKDNQQTWAKPEAALQTPLLLNDSLIH